MLSRLENIAATPEGVVGQRSNCRQRAGTNSRSLKSNSVSEMPGKSSNVDAVPVRSTSR